jgi:arylformamidase
MLPIELSIPLGIGTPAWPTYEPLQMKYFKRLAPNGANGQILTHSNHLGTHMDGEIHFYSPGKDMAALQLDFLMHEGAIVDLSDAVGDYDVYTSKMVEDRVEVKEGDILVIHTGYHHYGWTSPRRTRSATWSSTRGRTASSPSGAGRRSCAGSASTAGARTTR